MKKVVIAFLMVFFLKDGFSQSMVNKAIVVAGGNPWGAGANTFNYPFGNFVDEQGNIYIADYNNHRVQKWALGAATGITVAGGNGQGAAASQLYHPYDVFLDDHGLVYISDAENARVQVWAAGSSSGTTIAGGNGYGPASNQVVPRGIHVDKVGNLYIADPLNDRVQMWIPGLSTGITVAGGNGQGSAANQLNDPHGVFVDDSGRIYIADWGNHRIQRWDPGATSGVTVAGGNGQGSGDNQLYNPEESVLDSHGNILVLDRSNHRIQKWEAGATWGVTIWGDVTFGYVIDDLTNPTGIYIDHCDNVYVTALGNDNAIKKLLKVPVIGASGPTTFCPGGSVTLSAPPGYSYKWNTNETTESITVSTAGNYTVTVTDDKGCSSSSEPVSVTIMQPPPTPVITANGSTFLCNGATVTLTSTGTEVIWYRNGSVVGSGTTFFARLTGEYTTTAANSCGRSNTSDPVVVEAYATPAAPVISSSATNPVCNANEIILSASGSYIKWYKNNTPISGANGNTYSTREAGNYTATSSNYCGMSEFSNVISIITESPPPIPTISASGSLSFCEGNSVTLSAPDGYKYHWNTGETTRDITVRNTGSYQVTISNAAGCSSTSAYTSVNAVPVPAKPLITSAGPTTFCQGDSVILTAPSAYGYLWSNGATTRSVSVSGSGKYAVMVGNIYGCSALSDSVAVYKMLAAVNGSRTVCDGENVTLYASAGFSDYQWFLNGQAIAAPNGQGSSLTVSEGGVYTFKASIGEGSCMSMPFQVSKLSAPEINITTTAVQEDSTSYKNCGPARFNLNLVQPDNTGKYISKIKYDDGNLILTEDPSFIISKSAEVEVQLITGEGCAKTRHFSFRMNDKIPLPVVDASGPTTFCQGESVTLTAPAGYSYLWSNGSTARSITVGTAGDYSVRVSKADGCFSFSNPVLIMVNPFTSSN